jgi:hypothetical protein
MRAFLDRKPPHTDGKPMARKPNYGFERREREKARALKKAARQTAKQEKSAQRKESPEDDKTDQS